jgi:hypothetical protein
MGVHPDVLPVWHGDGIGFRGQVSLASVSRKRRTGLEHPECVRKCCSGLLDRTLTCVLR